MRVIAPITEETKAAGKRFAASHPELEIERYLMPKYDNAPYEPNRKEVVQAEAHGLRVQFPAAVASFRPALVVAGHETVARYMAPMGQVHGLPWVQLVRGSPTGEVLRGVYPRAGAARFLRDLGEADQIVTVAEFQADGLRNLGVANVTTIPNAIDTSRFRPRPVSGKLAEELRIRRGQIVVLVPANLCSRKRPLDVVKAAAVALNVNPALVFIMLGHGDLRKQVEQQCRRLGIRESFRFTGWIDYTKVPGMMNLADVVVMASESEGMARAYLEAMSCERLLVASDTPSARELIREGLNGLLFPMGDIECLASLIVQAATDPAMRRRVGREARRSLEGRSLAEAGRLYVEVFRSVVRAAASVDHAAQA